MAKRKNNKLLWGLLVLLVILIAIAYIKGGSKDKGERVSVEKVEKKDLKETVSASGKIFPETEVKISSDVSGEIVELYVEEGDSVKAGQILAKIDPEAVQSQVERGVASVNNAKAQLANANAGILRNEALYTQAKAQLEQIEAQLTNTKAIHERNIKLKAEGIISDADFDASLSNLEALKANVRSSIAAVKSAEANMESARQSAKASGFTVKSTEASLKEVRTSLSRTTIYAPTSGVVTMLNVEQGERVVGTMQMTGTEMMRIANLSSMEVQVDVSENDVLRVSLGDHVEIEVDAYLDRKFKGIVTQVANSATGAGNSASLTTDQVINFVVKIRIGSDSYKDLVKDGKSSPFRPGMSASVEINTHTEEGAVSVPIQAVTTREDKKDKNKGSARKVKNKDVKEEDEIKEVVFVASGDTVKMIEVKTGIQDDSYIQILSGVTLGDEVITGPYAAVSKKLDQGDQIKIVDEEDLYKKKD